MNNFRLFKILILILWVIGTVSCKKCAVQKVVKKCKPKNLTKSGLNPKDFENEYNGKPTALYTLTNENGMEVCITNFGGRIVSLMAPDRDGNLLDVVLGFQTVADYFPENNQSDLGAAIGRYANRIVGGQFELDGVVYKLPLNNGNTTIHGGPTGWQYQPYDVAEVDEHHLKLYMDSPDGDNNFPGHVEVYVTYTLTEDNKLLINYEGTTDKATVINMTNHSYFNIDGTPGEKVLDDILYINAKKATENAPENIPTGKIISVLDTPLDFTTPKPIGQDINETDFAPIANAWGYDHNFVLDTDGDITKTAAKLVSPKSGITLEVYTDEPGLVMYSSNWLGGVGKHGIVYGKHGAVCLESGKYPDSPNHSNFPSAVLRPGEKFESNCIYVFGVEN